MAVRAPKKKGAKKRLSKDAQFLANYRRLNPKQKEAVDSIQGPVMVIAGPGTGKTSILTLRIANILQKTDTAPDSILALTFTESGVYSMRKKLVDTIGGAAYRVGIFTFHGFANYIIERYAESFPRIVGGRPATAADQVRILERIFGQHRFKLIRPFGDIFYSVPKALHALRELKRENISPKEFRKSLRAEAKRLSVDPDRLHTSGRFRGELKAAFRERLRKIEKSLELAEVYERYEEALAAERLFDFEDMLLEAIRAMKDDRNLLLGLQEQYQYLLADEHQDANNAQNAMLELLTSFDATPNLFIVGDEKQAIYRFQGASLENFLYFKKLYPKAKLVNLEENYRSTQSILDAAHSLMEKGAVPTELPKEILRPRLRGQTKGGVQDIRFLEFRTEESELLFVVEDIKMRLKAGARPSEIAVLFRDNADALPLVEALERTDIPFSVLSDEDILSDEELGKFLAILRAAAASGNERLFVEMLHLQFLGVEPIALYRTLQFCHIKRHSLFDVLSDSKLRHEAGISDSDRLLAVFSDFSRWASAARNRSAGEAVEQIARESGFVRFLLGNRGSLRGLEKLDMLFEHLKALSEHKRAFKLFDFLDILERLQKHGIRLGGKGARPEFLDSVVLLTAHRAKGLEFDTVYIVGAVDGHFGGRRGREYFYVPTGRDLAEGEDGEDERRLFFVALTRARKEAIITMAREGKGKPKLPSQFIEDIDSRLLSREDTRAQEERLCAMTPLYLWPKINTGPSVTLKGYLQKVFLEQGLTVTSVNNFLSCPWEYFFKNLVRLPQLPEPHLSFGNAVHDALHRYFDAVREGILPKGNQGRAALLRFFEQSLERSPLPLREFEEYKERGKKALSGYLKWHKNFVSDTQNEFAVTGVFVPLVGEVSLLLRGKLDKIERNPDESVTVVDYKTGKPKSRAEVLGETKSSEGSLKRQLDFYKLLLDHFENGKYKMTTGVIDFIEPDQKGNYHREVFTVGSDDARKLLEEVTQVGKEIYTLAFWDKRCGERSCEYCKLREALR